MKVVIVFDKSIANVDVNDDVENDVNDLGDDVEGVVVDGGSADVVPAAMKSQMFWTDQISRMMMIVMMM